MHELAPPPDPRVQRGLRLEAIRRREELISQLIAEQRLDLADLARDRHGSSSRYVADELALVWGRSPRQARNRLEAAQLFTAFPAVTAKVADGTWLIDHADAVLDELARSGLEHPEQEQVLDLVLTRRGCRTPWELRAAVRTACVVLFPDHAAKRAEQATVDRDVRTFTDAPGIASLLASGPAPAIAAMMASLETMVWPPAPDDERSAAQRRFDALYDLVCGRATSTQWQAQVLVSLATLEGHDEQPAEIPGLGPIPAPQARELVQTASVRRVVVDDHGALVAVDRRVHQSHELRRLRTDPLETKDLSTDRYAVPKPLRRHLELRDRSCVFPGCPRPAAQCDKDHVIPWPRGSTSEANLANECEPHHHAKHDYFTVVRLPDGTVRWTTPDGRTFDRPPRPVLEAWVYGTRSG